MTSDPSSASQHGPPPPPPPTLTSSSSSVHPVSSSRFFLNKFSYQSDEEEPDTLVRKLLLRSGKLSFDNEESEHLLLSRYNQAPSITQEGPTCGLVALMMALELLGVKKLKLSDVLDEAKNLGYTYNGEMFSVINLGRFAEHLAPEITGILISNLSDRSTKRQFIEYLASGWPILIPYDADYNHQPCNIDGHRAHWAVILGFCVEILCPETSHPENFPLYWEKDKFYSSLYHLISTNQLMETDFSQQICNLLLFNSCKLYFYVKQGKSRKLRLFDIKSLLESNANLNSVNPNSTREYLLPEGGVRAGLNGQAILLKPKELKL